MPDIRCRSSNNDLMPDSYLREQSFMLQCSYAVSAWRDSKKAHNDRGHRHAATKLRVNQSPFRRHEQSYDPNEGLTKIQPRKRTNINVLVRDRYLV